jgi:hypothetical protein
MYKIGGKEFLNVREVMLEKARLLQQEKKDLPITQTELTFARPCPICGEEMRKDCNHNETIWFWVCMSCGHKQPYGTLEKTCHSKGV